MDSKIKRRRTKVTTNYYEKDKLLVFKINEEIDECTVKNIRRKADYEIERFMPREVIFDFYLLFHSFLLYHLLYF